MLRQTFAKGKKKLQETRSNLGLTERSPKVKKKKSKKEIIGWREWVGLPEFNVEGIKAKVDTGALTSALHATDIKIFKSKGLLSELMVEFRLHPVQREIRPSRLCRAPLVEWRKVRDSGGKVSARPVIETTVVLGERSWKIEVTLIDRNDMGFRMLLGRRAVKDTFLVDPHRSFLHR